MRFPQPLIRARLVKRYKRFLADVVLDETGEALTAHCPNPGAMLGLQDEGMTVWLSRSDKVGRKLPYTLELVEADGGLVGVNTMLPNKLVGEALAEGRIGELAAYPRVRAEVKFGAASRADFRLEAEDGTPCWVEVKNVHLMRTPGLAEFPDCVAARSLKHLKELAARVAEGERALMLFVVQRMDCTRFAAAADLDPAYAEGLTWAAGQGVEVLVYGCEVSADGVRIGERMAWAR
jgi:sugar fermentation stimulation protein A